MQQFNSAIVQDNGDSVYSNQQNDTPVLFQSRRGTAPISNSPSVQDLNTTLSIFESCDKARKSLRSDSKKLRRRGKVISRSFNKVSSSFDANLGVKS